MICSNCKSSIFEGAQTWGYHQLPSSASGALETTSCIICTCLEEEARSCMGLDFDVASNDKLYRWTIHRSPTFRESETSYTVRFRPDIRGYPRLQNAATKTFHLIDAESVSVNLTLGDKLNTKSVEPQLKAWLETCHKTHGGRCAVPDSPSWVPKRLVDIDTLPEGRVVVRETAGLLPSSSPKPRFLTLSHCWGEKGQTRMLMLVPDNLAAFTDPRRGIAKAQLPRNFGDAVEVARLLGVRYIWIDSLCILQDGEEFKTEGQLMHLVYRNSYCNLAAAASKDCEGGLFRDRQKIDKFGGDIIETTGASIFGRGRWRIFHSEWWSDQLLNEPLYRRGWVFQERMLSPRILHFASGQVFWDCASTTACETLPEGLPWPLDEASSTERYWRERLQLLQRHGAGGGGGDAAPLKLFGSADVSFESFWKEAVRNYTACALTYSADRLAAIWGVAKLVRDQFRLDDDAEDYGVGLWSSQLHEQLAWRARDPGRSQRPPELLRAAAAAWPSWSWASMIGPVELQLRSSEPGQIYAATNHLGAAIRLALAEVPREKAAEARGGGADNLPKDLQTNRLAVRGIFVRVAVEGRRPPRTTTTTHEVSKPGPADPDTHAYALRLADVNDSLMGAQSQDMFRVLPDSTSDFLRDSDGGDCYLFMLTASVDKEQAWDPPLPGGPDKGHYGDPTWIHGTGLVVVRGAPDEEESHDSGWQYRRIGVCDFEGFSSEDFATLKKSHISNIWLV